MTKKILNLIVPLNGQIQKGMEFPLPIISTQTKRMSHIQMVMGDILIKNILTILALIIWLA